MADFPTDAEKLNFIREKIADAQEIARHYVQIGISEDLAYVTAFDKIRGYLNFHEWTAAPPRRRSL